MTSAPANTADEFVARAIAALERDAADAEELALGLAEVSESVLGKSSDRLSEALLWADPPMAMRILNVLPAMYTRDHIDNYVAYLNHTGNPGFAAGAFVVFKARSFHRSNRNEWNLDKALWKWLRHTDNDAISAVLHTLGPDWGSLWIDYVAVVFGAGRLSRRLRRELRRMHDG